MYATTTSAIQKFATKVEGFLLQLSFVTGGNYLFPQQNVDYEALAQGGSIVVDGWLVGWAGICMVWLFGRWDLVGLGGDFCRALA